MSETKLHKDSKPVPAALVMIASCIVITACAAYIPVILTALHKWGM